MPLSRDGGDEFEANTVYILGTFYDTKSAALLCTWIGASGYVFYLVSGYPGDPSESADCGENIDTNIIYTMDLYVDRL